MPNLVVLIVWLMVGEENWVLEDDEYVGNQNRPGKQLAIQVNLV